MLDAVEAGESLATPLGDIFSQKEPAEKSASEPTEKEEKKESEAKPKDKLGDGSSSEEEKPEKEQKPKESKEPKSEKQPAEKKEAKDEGEKKEEPSQEEKDKWESQDNPYQKRFKDTQANWNREHQEKIQLQQKLGQMERETAALKKMVDGTYDPEKDDPNRQAAPEDLATQGMHVGKVLASKHAAVAQYGEDNVNAILGEFHQVFGQNQVVQSLVLNSDSPIAEAFAIMNRFKFEKKYGNSPETMYKSIREEYKKELESELRKEITEELMGRVDKKKSNPKSLSSSRGSSSADTGEKAPKVTPLSDIF